MTGQQELRALTSVRGIAAWMVVLYHIRLSIAGLPQRVGACVRQGLSGGRFLLPAVGLRDLAELGDRGCASGGWREVPAFLQKRVARIWPLICRARRGGRLALAAGGDRPPRPRRVPFGELPLHVLLLQNWGFTAKLTWNDPAWSISCDSPPICCSRCSSARSTGARCRVGWWHARRWRSCSPRAATGAASRRSATTSRASA